MASSTMAMLILFVVSTFFVHIYRLLNAVFFVQKNFSDVLYQKYVSYVSKKVIFSCVTNEHT